MRLFLALSLICIFSSEARELSWNDAVALVQERNLEYQAASANFSSAQEAELARFAGFLPKLTASASSSQSGSGDSTNGHSYSAQLSLNQNLFSGFSDLNNYYLKKTNTELAQATFNSETSRISQELKQAYAEVYYIQDYKKLAADILKRRVENNRNVKLQYDVGRENRGSLLLSDAYVDSAEYDLLKTTHDEEIFQENIRRILGFSSDEIIQISQNIAKENLSDPIPDFDAIALKHPDIVKAQLDEMSALYNARITRAQLMPSLDFTGSYGYSGASFFPDQKKWSLGLTLSVPLFEGFKTIASYRSLNLKYESNKQQSKNTVIKIKSTIRQAYFGYVEAIKKEKISESFARAALLRADVARSKYKNGFLTFEEWDVVETDLIARQKDMLLSEKDRVIKQSLWERAQGIGVFK